MEHMSHKNTAEVNGKRKLKKLRYIQIPKYLMKILWTTYKHNVGWRGNL
jgi:hypothetical protein